MADKKKSPSVNNQVFDMEKFAAVNGLAVPNQASAELQQRTGMGYDIPSFAASQGMQVPSMTPAAPAAAADDPYQATATDAEIMEFVDRQTDPLTGELRPLYASGLGPDAPIPISPLDPEQRAALSVGNDRGNMLRLKAEFEDADIDKHGNLVIKDKGMWYSADPSGLGGGDAWQRTRELMSDAVEAVPTALAIGGSVAAGIATGGRSLPIQAAAMGGTGVLSGLFRTSMGRAQGTYVAEPVEQLTEIALEGALNVAGVYIAPGIKYGLKQVSGLTKGISKLIPSGPGIGRDARDAAAMMWGEATGIGSGNITHMAQRPSQVRTVIDASIKASSSVDDQINKLAQSSLKQAESVLVKAHAARRTAYQKTLQPFFDKMPANATLQGKEAVAPMQSFFGSLGLIDDAGRPLAPKAMVGALKTAAANGDEATASMANSLLNDLSTQEGNEAYKILSGHMKTMLNPSSRSASGKEVGKLAVDIDQMVTHFTENNSAKAFAKRANGVGNFIKMTKSKFLGTTDGAVDGSFYQMLSKKAGAENAQLLVKVKSDWHQGGKSMGDIYNLAAKANAGDQRAVETFLNQMKSQAGRNINMYTQAESAAAQHGLGEDLLRIMDYQAAIAAAKPVNSTFAKFGPVLAVTGGVGGAMLSDDNKALTGLGVAGLTLAATSPKLASRMLLSSPKMQSVFSSMSKQAAQNATKSGFQMLDGMKMAGKLPPEQAAIFRNALISGWVQSIKPDLSGQGNGR